MFTGIITDTTSIKKAEQTAAGLLLTFARPTDWNDLELGESINTDGACLTIAALRNNEYDCLLMPETLAKTTFGSTVPEAVNLERSLQANGRFGGHFVQGHVDYVGEVTKQDTNDGIRYFINYGEANKKLVIQKGSIAINGVSLTVASLRGSILSVALIPHTMEHTTFETLKQHDKVNLEFDMIGKYIQRGMDKE